MHKKIYLPVIVGLLFFVSCKGKKQYYEESGTVFHTLYTIKYEAPHILTDKIDAELQKFNLSLNPFNPNSIIAKVNNNEAVEGQCDTCHDRQPQNFCWLPESTSGG